MILIELMLERCIDGREKNGKVSIIWALL